MNNYYSLLSKLEVFGDIPVEIKTEFFKLRHSCLIYWEEDCEINISSLTKQDIIHEYDYVTSWIWRNKKIASQFRLPYATKQTINDIIWHTYYNEKYQKAQSGILHQSVLREYL